VARLIAVLPRRHALQKIAADELLGERRPALRKERGVVYVVVSATVTRRRASMPALTFASTRGRLK
jgi:hypothetical protein